MNRAEIADELGVKENYIATHWRRIVDTYAKYNIILVKNGRGDRAEYGIKNFGDKEIRWTVRKDKRKSRLED